MHGSRNYRGQMARLKDFYEASEVFAGADRPTRDDVSLTLDGHRLDTPESVVEFFAAMRTHRADESEDD